MNTFPVFAKKSYSLISWAISLTLLGIATYLVVGAVYFFQTQVYTTGTNISDSPFAPHDDVSGNALGNDALSAFSYISWLDKFYPSLPFWFPLQGGGVSFISGYQWFAHYLVLTTHHFSHINLQMSFVLVRDVSFYISALGILFFCFFRLNYPKQKPIRLVIGLVAVYFFLVSPMMRYWSDKWGFFAETISYMFFAPAAIFLDYFIDLSFIHDTTWKKRVALLFGSFFYALAFHTHFMTGLAITNIFILLLVIKTIPNIFTQNWKAFKTAAIVLSSVGICVGILFGWRYMMFREYGHEVAKGGLSVNEISFGPINKGIFNFEKAQGNFPTLKQVLGIEVIKFPDARFVFQGYYIPIYIWFFALIGLLIGWIRSRKVLVLGILSLILFFCYSPNESGIFGWTIQLIQNIFGVAGQMFFGNRPSLTAGRMAVPIAAAYGAYSLTDVLLIGIDFLIRKTSKALYFPWENIIRPMIVLPAMIFVLGSVIYGVEYNNKLLLWNVPQIHEFKKAYDPQQPYTIYIGQHQVNLLNIWQKTVPFTNPLEQLSYTTWPKLELNRMPFGSFTNDKELAHLPNNSLSTRMDLSGLSGSLVMKAPIISNLSTTQLYVGNLSLIGGIQNFQTIVYYIDYPIYQRNNILSELAKWFGFEYVLAQTESNTAKSLYINNPEWSEMPENKTWYQFSKATGLATWTSRPAVLFIGNEEKFLYDQFLKNASIGTLSYDDAMISAGTSYIDDYSLDQLQQFKVLILSGYKYHNSEKGPQLLTKYVENGGSLFIDTGWQYNNPDWESKKLPPFFPTNGFEWKTLPFNAHFTTDNTQAVDYTPNTTDLGETSIRGTKWASSVALDVRSDSNVLVQTGNAPVMMSHTYGKGKVVWSGYNIIPYIEGNHNENQEQIELLHNVFKWLLSTPDSKNPSLHNMRITRTHPDHLSFTALETTKSPTFLYWREAYHPKWHATLIHNGKKQEITLYRTGPRFMGMHLPAVQQGDSISLDIQPSISEIGMIIFTLIGAIGLILHIFAIPERIAVKIVTRLKWNVKKIQSSNPEVISDEKRAAVE